MKDLIALLHPNPVRHEGHEGIFRTRRWLAVLAAVFTLTTARAALASTCTWSPSVFSTAFGTAGNWTCGHVPGSTAALDTIVFDGTVTRGSNNCTMGANATSNITTVTFSTYGGTFNANGNNLTITSNWTQPSGTFTGGSGTISIGGDVSITGTGSFGAPSGTLNVTGSFTNSATFTHNNGTVVLKGTSSGLTFTPGSTFYALTVNGSGGTYTLGGNLTTASTLTVSAGTLSTGSKNVSASPLTVNGGSFVGGSGTIGVTGTLTISSGTFTGSSTTTTISGNFTNSGTFTANNGTVSLTSTSATATITSGGFSFYKLTLAGSGTFTIQDSFSTSSTLTVNAGVLVTGSKSVSLGGLTIGAGTFNAPTGTLTLTGAFTKTTGTGTFNNNGGTFYFAATSPQSHQFGGAVFNNVQVGLGTSGLVGDWALDETSGTVAADTSTSNNTGTYFTSGVTHTTSVPPAITFTDSHSATLDGTAGYVTLGVTNFPANNAPQSISLWFNGNPNGGNENMLAMIYPAGGSAVQLGYRGSNLVVWSYGGTALVSTLAPNDSAWHNVIYAYDGVTDSLYLDGVLKNSSTTAVHQTSSPTVAYLGTYQPPNAELWVGSLDDVRVYNRALTAGEISLLSGGSSVSVVSTTHTFTDAFSCSGDFIILAGTVSSGSQTMAVGGDWFNGGTYSGTGTVTMNGTSATGTITTGGSSFGGLTVAATSTGVYTINDNVTVSSNLSITSGKLTGSKTLTVGGTFNNAGTYAVSGAMTVGSTFTNSGTYSGSGALTVASTFTNSGTYSGSGALTLTSATAANITSGSARFTSLTISGAGTYTLQDRLWVPAGTIALTSGGLNDNGKVIHAGALSGSGTFTTTGTVVFDGGSNFTLPYSTFVNLRIEDPSETNLVGYWKLDEAAGTVVRDSSGNGNNGTTASSGVTWSTTSPPIGAGKFDDYAYFTLDGSNGYASVGATNVPATDAAVTISAWVKVTAASAGVNQNIVALVGGGNLLQFGIRGTSYVVWPSGAGTSLTGPTVATGAWHHIAYTYSGTSGSGNDIFYLDGTAYSGTFTHQAGATTNVYIGSFSAAASELFGGSVDDVRIYNVALSATQIKQLAAGRYAGTGGGPTVTLGANTTVTGVLGLDEGSLDANGKKMAVTSTTTVDEGTYTVGSAAQTFTGGLTVNPYGVLTLASATGAVQMGTSTTLTIDGTLNASNTLAVIQTATSGQTYTFKVGSSATATPTLNISGLSVQNTNGGIQIGFDNTSTTNITEFDNVWFSAGSGTAYLQIKTKSMFLNSNGCKFDSAVPSPTKVVTMVGNTSGTGTRAIFGNTVCGSTWYVSSSNTQCNTNSTSKTDDDADNNGAADSPGNGTNFGSVVQFVRSAASDTAGSVIGFPSSAFDWNTFNYYSTYVAFHNGGSGGTADIVYVRDETGSPLYSWTVPTAGETITGTPQWNTTGSPSKHYLYVSTTQGHVYRLVDTGTGTSGTLTLDSAWTTNPFDCSCTISTPLAMDASNLYWGSTTSGKNFWTLGQTTESNPAAVSLTQTVTSAGMTIAPISGTTYAFMGVSGNFVKISTLSNSFVAANTSPVGHSINGRVVAGYNKSGVWRLYGGDNGGTMWAIDPGSAFANNTSLWSASAGSAIQSSPYYDHDTDSIQFGTDNGGIVALNAATGAAVVGTGTTVYPYTPVSGDPITAAPLYYAGILVIGSTGGHLYFIDRNTGTTRTVLQQYYFGPNESISGVGYDVNVDRYMVSTANTTTQDGRVYYFDKIADPTSGSL